MLLNKPTIFLSGLDLQRKVGETFETVASGRRSNDTLWMDPDLPSRTIKVTLWKGFLDFYVHTSKPTRFGYLRPWMKPWSCLLQA